MKQLMPELIKEVIKTVVLLNGMVRHWQNIDR
jgi:hypothetical protein